MSGTYGVQLWVERGNVDHLTTQTLTDNETIATRLVSELVRVPDLVFFTEADELDAWLTGPDLRRSSPLVGFSTQLARMVCGWGKFTHE